MGWDRLGITCDYLAIVCYYLAKGGGTTPILKNEEYYFYSTFDRITSGEVPIRVMAKILKQTIAFKE